MPNQPFDDEARLEALDSYRVLDTAPEAVFDNLTELVSTLLDVPIVLVSLVGRERQWFKSNHGLDIRETSRSVAICDHAIRQQGPFVVADAAADPRFRDNPLVTEYPCVRFYAGVPLRTPDGHALGTLCALGRDPRELDEQQLRSLMRFAEQAAIMLELKRRLALLDDGLQAQRETQRNKELLAAMVVHDLRSPLTTLLLAASMLQESVAEESVAMVDEMVSTLNQVQRQLMDVLDICLADTGELRPRVSEVQLGELLLAVATQYRHQARLANVELAVLEPTPAKVVTANRDMLGRILGNLLENALRYAPTNSRVDIDVATREASWLQIGVRDRGPGVNEDQRELIFQPYASGGEGRGLGLAFCRLAAEAHGGRAGVDPVAEGGSRFWVELPVCA